MDSTTVKQTNFNNKDSIFSVCTQQQEVVQTLLVFTHILMYNIGRHVSNSLVHHLAPELLHKLHFLIILVRQLI
jgi:hypothetical protein